MGISLPMAVLGSGALSAGAGIFGSIMGGNAQQSAAQTAANTQLSMYNQTRSDLMPFMTGGGSAFSELQKLMGLNGPGGSAQMMSQLQNYPGYKFALQQGNQALNQSMAARGLGLSGGQLRDAVNYNQGMASQLFGTYYNQLYGMGQLGENAAAMTGQLGSQAATGASNAYMYGGNAAAGEYAGIANAFSGGLQNALGAYSLEQGGMGNGGYNYSFGGNYEGGPNYNYALSDARLKTDIERVGETDSGLPIYTYRFKGSRLPQIGVIAQDVEEIAPHAVRPDPRTGYLRVDYRAISKLPPLKEAA